MFCYPDVLLGKRAAILERLRGALSSIFAFGRLKPSRATSYRYCKDPFPKDNCWKVESKRQVGPLRVGTEPSYG
jgi:hypothetical protein